MMHVFIPFIYGRNTKEGNHDGFIDSIEPWVAYYAV